jgi:NAD(P)H-dependent FMN reductase
MALTLQTIICSTRPGRVGPSVASWFHTFAHQHGAFESTLIDLADFSLPLLDEPNLPVHRRYQQPHTLAWSASVAAADAYVFVTPEYNYGPPPPFVNALNFLYHEWNYKPCGFVGYGGVAGGLRAVQLEKQLVTTLKMMPVPEVVSIPMVATMLDENKSFKPNDLHIAAAKRMLDEMIRWATALKTIRND